MTLILAIDLGKFKSVACVYRSAEEHGFQTLPTSPTTMHDLIVELHPDRVVIEVGAAAGWMQALDRPNSIGRGGHVGSAVAIRAVCV